MSYNRGDYRDKWRIEKRAVGVRSDLGLDQIQVLDPGALAGRLGAEIFDLSDLTDDEIALRRARSIGFDGMASTHPHDGTPIIVLNCGKPARRRTATLMEELGHLVLGHRPSRIYHRLAARRTAPVLRQGAGGRGLRSRGGAAPPEGAHTARCRAEAARRRDCRRAYVQQTVGHLPN